MKSMTLADWLVIVGYLAGITVIGTYAVQKVKSSTSFFISDRKFGKLMMIFLGFGVGTSSDQAVSVAAKTYRAGLSGIWYQWLWLPVTPFFWLLASLIRRMRAVTVADFFEHRYDRSVGLLYAIIGILQLMVSIGLMLKASAVMITAVSGGEINSLLAIVAMTLLFVIYGIAGGLSAAIFTDFVQGILTLVLSFLILPFALSQVGGLSGLYRAIDNPAMLSLIAPGEINAFFITVLAFNALIGWIAGPGCMLSGAGKTEMESRIGMVGGTVIKRICTVAWTLTGLCAVVLYADQEIKSDHVYGLIAHDLLPTIGPGMLGLFIASMLASVMSSCDASMVLASGLFIENIYRPRLVKDKSDRHYILMGRIASAMVVIGSFIFAYRLQSIVTGLEIFWKVAAMMGVAAWVGIFWRRATVAGAWISTLAGAFTWLFTEKISLGRFAWDFNATFAHRLPDFMLWEGRLYLPWQMLMYLSTSFTILVVVSLFTKRVDKEKLDSFYACLRTPIGPNEPETKAFELPSGLKPAPRRVLINHPDFEIPIPTATSVIGFITIGTLMFLIVKTTCWILSLSG